MGRNAPRQPLRRIDLRWERHQRELDLRISVPPGTTADIVLPTGDSATLGSGQHTLVAGDRSV
jgi:alpha-L-rhamnosidase